MRKTKRQQAISSALETLIPYVPYLDATEIRQKANQKHLRHLPVLIALHLATMSYVRHKYTDYDKLLETGLDRDAARYCVAQDMEEIIGSWGGSITATELLAAYDKNGE